MKKCLVYDVISPLLVVVVVVVVVVLLGPPSSRRARSTEHTQERVSGKTSLPLLVEG
jgi:hypothetical protein